MREKYWITYYDATNSEDFYNICKGGNAGPGGPMFKGHRHSEETKKRMSESRKGSRNANYGNHYKRSKELRERHSKLMSGKGNPMYGKKHSEETRRKISESRKGQESNFKGKSHTEENKRKFSEYMTNRNKGRKWITNGIENKFIDPNTFDLEKYFNNGWRYGRKFK